MTQQRSEFVMTCDRKSNIAKVVTSQLFEILEFERKSNIAKIVTSQLFEIWEFQSRIWESETQEVIQIGIFRSWKKWRIAKSTRTTIPSTLAVVKYFRTFGSCQKPNFDEEAFSCIFQIGSHNFYEIRGTLGDQFRSHNFLQERLGDQFCFHIFYALKVQKLHAMLSGSMPSAMNQCYEIQRTWPDPANAPYIVDTVGCIMYEDWWLPSSEKTYSKRGP